MQFNFTINKIREIDERVLSDLEVIKKILLENISKIYSLILVGGFGRGEGSVLLDNGIPKPMNDYDIVLISENIPDFLKLKKLSKEIAQEICIRLIDLIPIKNADASELPITMFNYDMKYGGYIFYGDGDFIRKMPDYDPSKMPLVEGKKLLFNRMICLLESFSEKFKGKEPDENEKFFLTNQSGKAILACCDSLLLLKGMYHQSYVERCKRFSEEFKDRRKLVDLVKQATDFKLRPKKKIDLDTVKYWFDAREVFINTMSEFLESFYGKRFEDVEMFNKFYEKEGVPLLRRLANDIGLKKSAVYRKNNIELLELALLYAIYDQSNGDRFLRLSRSKLKEISGNRCPENIDWESMRKECVRLWFKHLH